MYFWICNVKSLSNIHKCLKINVILPEMVKIRLVNVRWWIDCLFLCHSWKTNKTTKLHVRPKLDVERNSQNEFISGEEISENYFPVYTHIDKDSRHKWLLQHYCFSCQCLACTMNYKLLNELQQKKSLPWKCPDCKQLLLDGVEGVDAQFCPNGHTKNLDNSKAKMEDLKARGSPYPDFLNTKNFTHIACDFDKQACESVLSHLNLYILTFKARKKVWILNFRNVHCA